MNYYYSTQPLLAWCLNRHFYDGLHYVYVAPFYPYRLPNPKSSNPLEIYRDLYHPWRDRDEYDKTMTQVRLGLRKGVQAHQRGGLLDAYRADELARICDTIDIKFFFPIVYRVDIDALDPARLRKAGSGLSAASVEYLVSDLRDGEFDVLLYSNVDSDLQELWEMQVGMESALSLLNYHSRTGAVG
jgi:hypothetical protein